MVFQKVNNL